MPNKQTRRKSNRVIIPFMDRKISSHVEKTLPKKVVVKEILQLTPVEQMADDANAEVVNLIKVHQDKLDEYTRKHGVQATYQNVVIYFLFLRDPLKRDALVWEELRKFQRCLDARTMKRHLVAIAISAYVEVIKKYNSLLCRQLNDAIKKIHQNGQNGKVIRHFYNADGGFYDVEMKGPRLFDNVKWFDR